MRRPPSNIDAKKEIEKTTITSFKNNPVKPTDSDDKTIQKSNILVKTLGLETYFDPVPGQFILHFSIRLAGFYFVSEAHWVDEASKRVFPIAFLIFNIAFWSQVYTQSPIEQKLIDDGFIQFD